MVPICGRINMPFMQAEITESRQWAKSETPEGTCFIPIEYYFAELGDLTEIVTGFGARLSAPGYLDCTDWVVFPTEEEAKRHLMEMYDLDENLQDLGDEEYAEEL